MCYKHGGGPSPQQKPSATGSVATKQQPGRLTLFPNHYFQRVASQAGCAQCQDRVSPEEVKSALGVCTVFLLRKTMQWIAQRE